MPRVVVPEVHTVKREAFVDAAQRLMLAKGYEAMSVQEVLDDVGASRGAFYHYFDSKQALLEAVTDRVVDAAMAAIEPIVADPSLPAVRKLERVFGSIATFKEQRKELMLRLIEVWVSDANAILREKLRRRSIKAMTPYLSRIITEGIGQEVFVAESPEQTASVLVSMMMGFQERAVELFLARQSGAIEFQEVRRSVDAWTRAYERVLGAEPGSVTLADERTLHVWFG